uniref:AlNc14C304G10422 protein n=1 Tax=Albugo laibachii Nc14 TaxID=890382 RepID=F0WVW2_9STRA|nr:AlNc14C304G10422 [Albugo laibachii Nc14]|eukprot:CCA25562.1 AlNc14C304G10422 [Albugo laibachii Nc14]
MSIWQLLTLFEKSWEIVLEENLFPSKSDDNWTGFSAVYLAIFVSTKNDHHIYNLTYSDFETVFTVLVDVLGINKIIGGQTLRQNRM